MATKPKKRKNAIWFEETELTLYQHKKVIVEMMKDRGYDVPDDESTFISSFETYSKMMSSGYESVVIYEHTNPMISSAYVSIYDNKDITALKEYPYLHHIIINRAGKKIKFSSHELPRHSFEIIDYNFFAINPTKHFLAPEIRILKPVESKVMLSKTGWTLDKLPGISTNDALVKYYGVPVGSVIEFIRTTHLSFFNKKEYYWRVVRSIPIISDNIALVDENNDDPGFGDDEVVEEEEEDEEDNVPLPDIYE